MKPTFELYIVAAAIAGAFNIQAAVDDEKTAARESLDSALVPLFAGKAGLKSDELAERLINTAQLYPKSEESITAKLLYAGHLQALERVENLNEAQGLYRDIIAASPNGWQASLARLHLAATYGLQGNYQQMLISAKDGLAHIDFASLEKSSNKDFQRLLGLHSTQASDIEESFKVLLAKGHLKTGNLTEAENVLNSVHNAALKRWVAGGVEIERKRRERNEVTPKP